MKSTALVLLLISSFASAEPYQIPGNEHTRGAVTLDQPVSLEIVNDGGNIRIVESEGSTLEFEADNATPHEATLHVEGEGDARKIWIEYPKGRASGGFVIGGRASSVSVSGSIDISNTGIGFNLSITKTATVHLTLKVPRTMLRDLSASARDNLIEVIGHFAEGERTPRRRVALWTETGSITCEGMCAPGRLILEAQNGNEVRTRKVLGPTFVHTETASVDLRDSIGTFEISGGDGRVEVDNVVGDLTVMTERGDVRILGSEGNLAITTEGGDVEVVGQRHGGIDVQTETGDIEMKNPQALYEKLKTEAGKKKRTRKIPKKGERGPSPLLVDACVDELVRTVDSW